VERAAAEVLLGRAREARAHSYAPYSNFPVGAALLSAEGRVFTGTNVENASYGLTTCAERTAVVKAVSEGARDFVAIAIIGPQDDLPCPPCGSCLQILHELAPGIEVVTPDEGGAARARHLSELLPAPFAGARLRAPLGGSRSG
jgi:cytidine deaminase